MSSKEKKQKRKVAWSEEDEVLRQALIDNAEAYAKAQEKVLSIPGEEYDDDFMKENDNPEEHEDEFDIIENERVDGKTSKQDFQDYGINGEDFVEREEGYGSDLRSVKG
ncbi:hypothetical protein RhiirA1_476813 [Rhizophagus irregularis]|uniref:Uncharacterized protein n=1 Tax=Rhizophagus irregularis TaxID=588596 RepID=A0A2N0QUK3_9GLOM|nr:hypothetical protein RhiirA1_476813 [Rhizophagus irregularis]